MVFSFSCMIMYIHLLSVQAPKHLRQTSTAQDPTRGERRKEINRDRKKMFAEIVQRHRKWTLSADQQTEAEHRLAEYARDTRGFLPRDVKFMQKKQKCWIWDHIVQSGVLIHVFNGLLPRKEFAVFASLCSLLMTIFNTTSDAHASEDMEAHAHERRAKTQLSLRCIEVLCGLETRLPCTRFVQTLHNVRHFPDCIHEWNNVRGYWAFAMERQNDFYKQLIHNRKDPGATVVARYSVHALIRHCSEATRKSINSRWTARGLSSVGSGVLTSAAAKFRHKLNTPGSGRVTVSTGRRQTSPVRRDEIKPALISYIGEHAVRLFHNQFSFSAPTTCVRSIKNATLSVRLDGHDLLVGGPLGIAWEVPGSPRINVGKIKAMFYIYSTNVPEEGTVIVEVKSQHAHLVPMSSYVYRHIDKIKIQIMHTLYIKLCILIPSVMHG